MEAGNRAGAWRDAAFPASARPPRRSFLPRASSMKAERRPRPVSRAKSRVSFIRVMPIRRSTCSRSASCLLEGAEDARATASGMAAVSARCCAASAPGGDHVRRRPRAVRLVPLGGGKAECRNMASRPRWSTAPRWRSGKRRFAEHQAVLPGEPDQPDAGGRRSRRRGGARQFGRCPVVSIMSSPRRCSRSRWNSAPTSSSIRPTKHIDGQGRCLGGVILSDKAWIDENLHGLLPPHRAGAFALQRMDAPEGAGGRCRFACPADRKCRSHCRSPGADHPKIGRVIYPGR